MPEYRPLSALPHARPCTRLSPHACLRIVFMRPVHLTPCRAQMPAERLGELLASAKVLGTGAFGCVILDPAREGCALKLTSISTYLHVGNLMTAVEMGCRLRNHPLMAAPKARLRTRGDRLPAALTWPPRPAPHPLHGAPAHIFHTFHPILTVPPLHLKLAPASHAPCPAHPGDTRSTPISTRRCRRLRWRWSAGAGVCWGARSSSSADLSEEGRWRLDDGRPGTLGPCRALSWGGRSGPDGE